MTVLRSLIEILDRLLYESDAKERALERKARAGDADAAEKLERLRAKKLVTIDDKMHALFDRYGTGGKKKKWKATKSAGGGTFYDWHERDITMENLKEFLSEIKSQGWKYSNKYSRGGSDVYQHEWVTADVVIHYLTDRLGSGLAISYYEP